MYCIHIGTYLSIYLYYTYVYIYFSTCSCTGICVACWKVCVAIAMYMCMWIHIMRLRTCTHTRTACSAGEWFLKIYVKHTDEKKKHKRRSRNNFQKMYVVVGNSVRVCVCVTDEIFFIFVYFPIKTPKPLQWRLRFYTILKGLFAHLK